MIPAKCDYPECTKNCGNATGYCHKARAAQPAPVPVSYEYIQSLLKRVNHKPGMDGYECYSFGDVAHAVRKAMAAQPAPVPVPLTGEQIDKIWHRMGSFTDRQSDWRIFARAIERAHGIGATP